MDACLDAPMSFVLPASEGVMYQQNPIDQARERTEQGEQPYKDARETLRQEEADLRNQAPGQHADDQPASDEEAKARLEADARERFRDIGDEVREGDDPA